MRIGAIIVLLLFAFLLFLLDWYVFQGVKSLTAGWQSLFFRRSIYWSFLIVNIGLPVFIAVVYLNMGRMNAWFTMAGSVFLTLLISKIVFVAILAGGDLFRVAEGGFNWLANSENQENFLPGRRKFFSQLAFSVAIVPFTSFLYGITKGKYNFKVHRHTLYFDDLPKAFDGFTIAQISDIHAGSFDNMDAVRQGVEMINAQHADLFVFTGDLVNSVASEFDPWVEIFKKIKAPYGQFSILGNHDYGDYHAWPTEDAKAANLQALKRHHADTGFRLLLDECVELEKDGQKIVLAGVENWGLGFGKRGDLRKALRSASPDAFKILLSHDPTHWDNEVKNFKAPVQLTLSGHTHGMQMGVEFAGLRWSPSKYRYPKWAGIYQENDRYINVNRGFGFLGFSGRVGIWPEITVLELKHRRKEI